MVSSIPISLLHNIRIFNSYLGKKLTPVCSIFVLPIGRSVMKTNFYISAQVWLVRDSLSWYASSEREEGGNQMRSSKGPPS